jgi:hypothetical protein
MFDREHNIFQNSGICIEGCRLKRAAQDAEASKLMLWNCGW